MKTILGIKSLDEFNSRLDTADDRISEPGLVDKLKLKEQEKKKLNEDGGDRTKRRECKRHIIYSEKNSYLLLETL